MSGCAWLKDILFSPTGATPVQLVETALARLDANSASWQQTLRDLESELIKAGKDILANEVRDLTNHAVGAIGSEVRCNIDFVLVRVKNHLRGILHRLDSSRPVPPLVPGLCTVTPEIVDLARVQRGELKYVSLTGYDFAADQQHMAAVVVGSDGVRRDVSSAMATPTTYLLTIALTPERITFAPQDRQLAILFAGDQLSTLNVIQPPPPQPQVMLSNFRIYFHTNDENKDHDTRVTVRVDGVFSGESYGEEWGDNSDHHIQLGGEIAESAMRNRTLSICIAPNGNDTWRFNFVLAAERTGGPEWKIVRGGNELNQDHRCMDVTLSW